MSKIFNIKKFLKWRLKHISHHHFIMILSVFVGLAAGLIAVVIKNSVHFIQNLLTYNFVEEYENYLYFIYPTVGILFTVLIVKFVIRQRVGHGIPSVLFSIAKTRGQIKPHNIFSSIITSSFTVGFGGSVGLEGPTVATSAAVGSNIGRFFHLNYKQIILLLGAASAGAMASIFKAPITAVIFAIEVIMIDLTLTSIIPLIIASITASLTSLLFLGFDVIYKFEIKDHFSLSNVPYYILLGVISGLIAVYFTKTYISINNKFDFIKSIWARLAIGGTILGLLIFFFPSLYGEGFESINSALSGYNDYLFNNSIFYDYSENIYMIFLLFALIIIFKVVATATTFGAGGIGGIFAPSLFLGSNLGLFFATFVNHFGFSKIPATNFALVGMAGLISGNLHAPLTAVFLIAEITGGYELFIPLMIVSLISYLTVKIFSNHSVYTFQLAKRGELMTHNPDQNILNMMSVKSLAETDFTPIQVEENLGSLVKIISESNRNTYPVIDSDGQLLGLVLLDDIRTLIFKPEIYETTFIADLMTITENIVDTKESMQEVADKFHKTGSYNMPIVENGVYIGFISRANLFSSYRRKLKYFSED